MLASVATFAIEGIGSREVTVEVDVRVGLPTFTLVGLPDRAVRESRERVRAAVLNSGHDFPLQRLTVNLAPADLRKAGPGFDLAIAVALLAASRQVEPGALASCAVCGELSLGGALRTGRGRARRRARGARGGLRPARGRERGRARGGARRRHRGAARAEPRAARRPAARPLVPATGSAAPAAGACASHRPRRRARAGRRAAGARDRRRGRPQPAHGGAAGGRQDDARKTPAGHPVAAELRRGARDNTGPERRRHRSGPARLRAAVPRSASHHLGQGLVGGGRPPRPGEVTLAHCGVLFLDELGEFARSALDALRQPLEEGRVEIMRGQRTITFPARVLVVAACNPCPCGGARGVCRCGPAELGRYERRLSGPLLDRFDVVCRVGPVPPARLVGEGAGGEASASVRGRVVAARERQAGRLAGTPARCNGDMGAGLTRAQVPLAGPLRARLLSLPDAGLLSGRAHDRVLRVARTIADLDGRDAPTLDDLDEALAYRLPGASLAAA